MTDSFEGEYPTQAEVDRADRRERYLSAAARAIDWRYGTLGGVVDAVMAVADEELHSVGTYWEQRIAHKDNEIARLCVILADYKHAIEGAER